MKAQTMTVDYLLDSITLLTKQMREVQGTGNSNTRFDKAFDVRSAPLNAIQD